MIITCKNIFYGLLLIGLLAFSCKNKDNKVAQSQSKRSFFVKVQPALQTKMISYIDITGTIEANNFTDIKSPATGFLESLFARENQYVEKDKLISLINPGDRVALISNNQLIIDGLEKELSLAEKNSGDYLALKIKLEEARQNFSFAMNMYQMVPVICPLSGLVTKRWVDIGGQVTAGDKLLTVTDMTSLVVKAEVSEKYFESIRRGNRLPLKLNAYPNDSIGGVISLVYPQIDPATRSVKFDIRIENFRKPLYPGMMASMRLPVMVKENALAVPEHAVLTSPDGKNFVFVVNQDSIANRRVVEKGIVYGNKVEVLRGIETDDKVVVEGQEMLKDGLRVIIMETPKK